MNEWQLTQIINENSGMSVQSLSDSIISECIHEDKLQNKGGATKFKRSTKETKQIARNFMIMKKLQKKVEQSSRSILERTYGQNNIENQCRTLTNLMSPCEELKCELIKNSPYRRIDACCNNIAQRDTADNNKMSSSP